MVNAVLRGPESGRLAPPRGSTLLVSVEVRGAGYDVGTGAVRPVDQQAG